MKKNLRVLIALCLSGYPSLHTKSQNLDFVPPILSHKESKDTSTSFIVTTTNLAIYKNKLDGKIYSNSIQIIDADVAWPPRWYGITLPLTKDVQEKYREAGRVPFNFFQDASVEKCGLQFYKIQAEPFINSNPLKQTDIAAYVILDKDMNPVDSIRSDYAPRNLYFHRMDINESYEKLVSLRKDTYLDLRDYTVNPKDSAVHGNVDYIHILDKGGNLIFRWNPLEFLDPSYFRFSEMLKERTNLNNNDDMIEWTRLTSTTWDYDGNILACFKNFGIFKISRTCKNIIWKIDYNDLPLTDAQNNIVEWYDPHDINFLFETDTTVSYSIYSNGHIASGKPACGVIFELHKTSNKVQSVKYIKPQTNFQVKGQGNVDCYQNGTYVMAYGSIYDTEETPDYRPVFEYGRDLGALGVYSLPKWIYIFRATKLQNWPNPPRPQIKRNQNMLEAVGPMENWKWYQLEGIDNTIVTPLGEGQYIKAKKGITYCVEGKYGMGYSVSLPFKM